MGKRRSTENDTKQPGATANEDTPTRRRTRFRRRILVGLLLLLASGTWYFGGLAVFPRAMARKSLELRDFETAWWWVAVANRVSRRDPANALLAARVARWQQDTEQMTQQLTTAEQWGADPQAVRREQVLSLAQTGQLDDEDELMQWLADGGEEAAEVSDAYANGLAMLARFEEAVLILDAWRNDFPADPRPEYRIGRIQEHQQLYEQAEASYRRALSRRGSYFPARYSLGRVLLRQRRAEEAVQHFQACLDMPYPEAAQVELAVALKALGRADEARPLLRQVLTANPERLQASYLVIEEQPAGFKAAAEYGRLESEAGNFTASEPWLVAALEADPLDQLSRYALAVTLRGLGKQTEAEQQFARVKAAREAMEAANPLNNRIQRDPSDLEARYLLGKLILEHESERMGLYWIGSIFSYDSEYAPAHELLAGYYAARSREDSRYGRLADYHRRKAQASRNQQAP